MASPLQPDPWKLWHAIMLTVAAGLLVLWGFILGVRAVPACSVNDATSSRASAA